MVLRISLLTDYGLADGFVAACHGVVASIAPAARVQDVTHLVPPGDVRRGALILAQTLPYLPSGVHVGVVDPGVGTSRRGIALTAGGHVLVGPDNGLLPWAAEALGGIDSAHELTNPALMREKVSRTFHGRDIFVPVAAHIATGTPVAAAGRALDPRGLVRLPAPLARLAEDGSSAEGEVLTVDHFGNVQTSLREEHVAVGRGATLRVEPEHAEKPVSIPLRGTFGEVGEGELVACVDSAGYLAIAVNGGSAAARLDAAPGSTLHIAWST